MRTAGTVCGNGAVTAILVMSPLARSADPARYDANGRITSSALTTDRTRFLIIGSGIAGLRAAIGLAGAGQVTILTKADPSESNTGLAQGGIAAAIGDDDS